MLYLFMQKVLIAVAMLSGKSWKGEFRIAEGKAEIDLIFGGCGSKHSILTVVAWHRRHPQLLYQDRVWRSRPDGAAALGAVVCPLMCSGMIVWQRACTTRTAYNRLCAASHALMPVVNSTPMRCNWGSLLPSPT